MSHVSTSRLRAYLAGGTYGAGGTAADASGLYVINPGFNSPPRIGGATLNTSGAGGTSQVSRHALFRISGLNVCIQTVSAAAPPVAAVSVTAQGYWWAQG